ncbi:14916_t:CDS:2 [Funneliformis geosporum]|uniref:14916_t:CDS:1 n=1 Tax=Funneliformis geosporum TaxID=1117311 RepID=A0A9W4STI4_9GLOM|nr:14916_t:CDS:2 [Funneliformis geosporum]
MSYNNILLQTTQKLHYITLLEVFDSNYKFLTLYFPEIHPKLTYQELLDGICERDNDLENKGKTRKGITLLDIRKGKVGNGIFNRSKNLIEDLKFEGFTNLRTLIISSHQLISLDVSECKNLEKLDCQNNKLTKLNVNNCHYLNEINCSSNPIRELNLSMCTNLNEVDINSCSNLNIDKIKSSLSFDSKNNKLTKNGPQITLAKEEDVRNILVIGTTGSGKSTLANVLANDSKFEERDSTTNTNSFTIMDILYEIGRGIYAAENKINQVIFVISGRFTSEQINAFNIFKNFIAESRITEFTTIDKSDLLAESQELRKMIKSCNGIVYVNNPPIPIIDEEKDSEGEIEDKKGRISRNEKKRKESREKIFDHLAEYCLEVYKFKE